MYYWLTFISNNKCQNNQKSSGVMHRIKMKISLFTISVMVSTIILLQIFLFDKTIHNSPKVLIYYILFILLIAYLGSRLISFMKNIIYPKKQIIHSLSKETSRKLSPMSYDKYFDSRSTIGKKNIIISQFQEQVRKAKHQNYYNSQKQPMNNLSFHPPNQQIFNSNRVNEHQMELQENDSFSIYYGNSDNIINEIKNIMNNINNDWNMFDLSQELDDIFKQMNLRSHKDKFKSAMLKIQNHLKLNLQSSIYQQIKTNIQTLDSLVFKNLQLHLSVHQQPHKISITQLRQIVMIYRKQKCLPLKYTQKLSSFYISPQTIDNIQLILHQLPNIDSQSAVQLSLYFLSLSRQFSKEKITIINQYDQSICLITQQKLNTKWKQNQQVEDILLKAAEIKQTEYNHTVIIHLDNTFSYSKFRSFRTSKLKVILLLFCFSVQKRYAYQNNIARKIKQMLK